MIKWFSIWWWKYLFEPRKSWRQQAVSWLTTMRCRLAYHPCGTVYYNPGGLEPDMRCKDCGEDLG